jgi:predicted RNase H-like HicB family nuclease
VTPGKRSVEVEPEEDGRWLAEVPGLPGVLADGPTRPEAIARAQALCLRVLADRLEHGEDVPEMSGVFSVVS